MKYLILSALMVLVSVSSLASSLRIPLIGDENVSVKMINTKLKLKGSDKIPEYVVVQNSKQSADNTTALLEKINRNLDKLNEKYNTEYSVSLAYFDNKDFCYNGNALDVPKIIGRFIGSLYSEQIGFYGWKYKNDTYYDDVSVGGESELNEYLSSETYEWAYWNSERGDAILLAYHATDDGDDVNTVIINRCK